MAREPEAAAFEPARVAGRTRRPVGILVGWLAALVGIAGVAAVNVVPSGDDGRENEAVAESGRDPAVRSPTAEPLDRPIAILAISEARGLDATWGAPSRRLEVAGRMLVRATRVRITLEGREDRILATLVRQPLRSLPRIGPILPRMFTAVFELPPWRYGGMWVTVTAFGHEGQRIGRLRQRVEVYPLPAVETFG
ncbi:MAG TPA: hypothetical protein VK831_07970 [Candidatus Deferrimicrobiaceae bacterium]|nr:hypothetical protein [Candidatus Deferrimicrobiaceae bacterium]